MAPRRFGSDAVLVQYGPSTQTAPTASCCGTRLQVVALTRDDARGRVELVRCTACGLSTWRLDGVEVDKERALGALSAAFAPAAAAPAPVRTRARATSPDTTRPSAADESMAELLAGWRVLGDSG